MARVKKTTRITVETHHVSIIREMSSEPRWCGTCGDRVEMVAVDTAAALSGLSPRAVYRKIEAGELHCDETGEGLTLVCLPSLRARASPKTQS